jgi:uncharacterized damage-inducible protein DinB
MGPKGFKRRKTTAYRKRNLDIDDKKEYNKQFNSRCKTPAAILGAKIYINAKQYFIMKKVVSFLSLMFLIALTSKAQFADTLKGQLLKDWKRSKLYTLDYLKTMPDAKFSFRPQDSVRTFAQQMIHLSQGTVSLMEAATGMKIPNAINRQDLEVTPSALAKDSVAYFVNLSYDYAIQALMDFDMTKSYQYVRRGKFNETRIAWMLKAIEHQAHHRGQTTIYIRALGLKPPNERLFDNMYE